MLRMELSQGATTNIDTGEDAKQLSIIVYSWLIQGIIFVR